MDPSDLPDAHPRMRAAADFAARVRAFSDELRTWRESTDRYAAPASAAPRDPSLYAIVERQQEELSVADEELRVQAEELENAVAVAHAERRRYRELFQQAFDAMFLTDRAGVIVDANASAARLLATESRFLHGRPLAKLVDPADLRRVSDLAAQAHERSRTALSTQIRRADGSRIDVVLACVAVDEGTRVLWSTVPAPHGDVEKPVAERIASLERANRDAEELVAHERATRRRLEEENRMLRRFFAVVANDLAGPVNAVLSWASTLRLQHNARAARVRALEAIESSAQKQLSILERLLDLPRVMADELRLDVSVVDLAALARAVVARFASAAADGGITLRVEDRSGDANAFVFGDARRLEQILEQLLENAIRFTPGGGTIDVVIARSAEHVELTVRDTGRGLDGTQLRAFVARTASGMGHYLVRRLADVHGGTVEARSDGPGTGTTVVVRLPARDHTSSPQVPTQPADTLEGARVLLVEDDVDARDVVAAVLGHRGATVASARDGEEALALVRSFDPHVIVSTIGSSEIDGFTLVRRLRHEVPDASAVALGVASRAEARRGAGFAFDIQLPRPIDPSRLVDAVRDLLAQS